MSVYQPVFKDSNDKYIVGKWLIQADNFESAFLKAKRYYEDPSNDDIRIYLVPNPTAFLLTGVQEVCFIDGIWFI